MIWLPKPVYETLPYLALLTGVICLINALNPFMVISAILLILVNTLVLRMRISYRGQLRAAF